MGKGPLESGEVERKLGEGTSGQTLVREGEMNPAVSHLTRSGLNGSFKMISGDCPFWVPEWNIIQQTHCYVANLQPSIKECK